MSEQFFTLSGSWQDWLAVGGYISLILFVTWAVFVSSSK